MSPTYRGYVKDNNGTIDIFNGDFLVLQKKTPQVGDVILFKPVGQNKLYLHRIISKIVTNGHTLYLTKGDGNRYTDISSIGDTQFGWIPAENVVGVVVFNIHWIGWFVDELVSLNFLVPLAGVIILGSIIYYTGKDEIHKILSKLKWKPTIANSIKFKNKTYSLRFIRSQKLMVLSLIGLLLLTSVGVEFMNFENNRVGVELLQTDGKPLPSNIDLGNPHLFDLETVPYGNQSVNFLDIHLKLTSGGLFNSLDSVTIRISKPQSTVNPANEYLYYKWNTVSEFSGSKEVSGVLVFPTSFVQANTNVSLTITIQYTVSHIFLQQHVSRNQTVIFS